MAKPTRRRSVKSRHVDEKETASKMTRWRKQMTLLCAGVFAIGLVLGLFMVGVLLPPRILTPADREILQRYEEIRSALASDDLTGAREASSRLARANGDRPLVIEAATRLSQAKSLEASRIEFKALSAVAVKLAASQPGYFILACTKMLDCPEACVKCPMDQFGKWVQISATVENPFMGKHHSRCGIVIRRTAPRQIPQERKTERERPTDPILLRRLSQSATLPGVGRTFLRFAFFFAGVASPAR